MTGIEYQYFKLKINNALISLNSAIGQQQHNPGANVEALLQKSSVELYDIVEALKVEREFSSGTK